MEMNVAGEKKQVKFDSGFNGAIAVTQENWDKIMNKLTGVGEGGEAEDGRGDSETYESGTGKVSLVGIGPEVDKEIINAGTMRDLVGTEFFHNLEGYEMIWDFGAKTITIRKKEGEQTKEGKKKERKESFQREREENERAYASLKNEITTQHAGKYVAIVKGRLVAVESTYEQAVAKATKRGSKYLHRLVFKAGEEPKLKTIRMELGRRQSR